MPRQETIKDWLKAVLLWLGLGASLGLYYRIVANDAGGWLLPYPEALCSALLVYFAEVELSGRVEILVWLVGVVLTGVFWVGIQTVIAPFFDGRRAHFSMTLVRAGLSALPLSLVGLWLVYVAGKSGGGWRFAQFMDTAMGRGGVRPWEHLNVLYLGLAVLALLVQLRVFSTCYDVKGRKALGHFVSGKFETSNRVPLRYTPMTAMFSNSRGCLPTSSLPTTRSSKWREPVTLNRSFIVSTI